MPHLRSLVATAALAGVALLPAACGGTAAAPPTGPSVVASTDVYGSIATAVAGSGVPVRSIINSPTTDPHEYESTPADVVAVGRASLVVYNGAGYDDFATKILDSLSTKPQTIDVAQLSGLQAATPAGQDFNEHVWYSFPTVRKVADTIAADLARTDPARAATFRADAEAFDTKVEALSAKVAAIKAKHAGERVAVTEPVPLYLVQAAGLVDATPQAFAKAVEDGNDPPAAVLQQTLALFSGPGKVAALLPNAQTESPLTRQVEQAARAGGVPVVPVTETLPAGAGDYVTWMNGQVDALAAALG